MHIVFDRHLLSIRVHYSRFDEEHILVQSTLGLNREAAELLANANLQRRARRILVGTCFILEGGLVVVTHFDSDSDIISNDNTGLEQTINIDVARDLIRKYITGNQN